MGSGCCCVKGVGCCVIGVGCCVKGVGTEGIGMALLTSFCCVMLSWMLSALSLHVQPATDPYVLSSVDVISQKEKATPACSQPGFGWTRRMEPPSPNWHWMREMAMTCAN